jgi:hypothetical protein
VSVPQVPIAIHFLEFAKKPRGGSPIAPNYLSGFADGEKVRF